MLPIVGYTNKLTAEPGETVDVMVSSFGAKTYSADLRQIIQGDTNPEGPGYKDHLITLDLGGTRTAISKPFKPGSCVIVPGLGALPEIQDFTLAAVVRRRCLMDVAAASWLCPALRRSPLTAMAI